MLVLKTTIWCLLILGSLSAIQTDAFARGRERPAYHPPVTTDQKDQLKAMTSCYADPGTCTPKAKPLGK